MSIGFACFYKEWAGWNGASDFFCREESGRFRSAPPPLETARSGPRAGETPHTRGISLDKRGKLR